ncbi:MAG TPA: diaminopimelate decarboxylase [Acidimicrobiales bacterium]|nr:diaminopimelate decarboxylase [Acidimicrobiales bacterium]
MATVTMNPPVPACAPPLPQSLLPGSARVHSDGHLFIGEVDVLDLVAEVGTPALVYDEGHLRRRCQQAVAAFGPGVAYASKAFLCKAMALLVAEEGMNIDVSSGGELLVALAAGVEASRLVMHGNNKSDDELATALDHGIGRIVVDSFDEIARLERLAPGHTTGRRPAVLIRLNPGTRPHTHAHVATGQEDSKFGFSLASGAAAAAAARLRRRGSPVELVGVHTHMGSQIFDPADYLEGIARAAAFLVPLGLGELCVGGGFGVSCDGEEHERSLSQWGALIHELCRRAGVPESVRISAEPGRAIAATAAVTCYTIGTVKELPGLRTYVSVDGGMSDNLRPALYGSRYQAFLPRATLAQRTKLVTVAGKHCESGDVLVRNGHLPDDTAVGDVLAIPVTGAYCYAMASNYNKVPRPPVVFVNGSRHRVVVRRETDADLLRLDS